MALTWVAGPVQAQQELAPSEGLPDSGGMLVAGASQQILQEPPLESALHAHLLVSGLPEAFDSLRKPVPLLRPALQLSGLRYTPAPDWAKQVYGPVDYRLERRSVDGWRVVEVAPLADPLRPLQRPSRALEVPALATTAWAQEVGLPVRACIHRFRVPSRIGDNGSFSIKAQWHVGCRF